MNVQYFPQNHPSHHHTYQAAMSKKIQFLLYSLPDEEGKVQVVIKDETIWCTQKAMAQLFCVDKSGISRQITNILKEGELDQDEADPKVKFEVGFLFF